MEYINFDLRIGEALSDGVWRVDAHCPLAGDAKGRLELDLAAGERNGQTLAEIGKHLFRAAFSEAIGHCYLISRARLGADQGLRLNLHIEEPVLAVRPWELLYDEQATDDFVALSLLTPLVRYIPSPLPLEPLVVKGPLRVLLAAASPLDQRRLDLQGELSRIKSALQSLETQGLIAVDCLEHTTKISLQDQLRRQYHVFHYLGHGLFEAAGGALCLEDASGFTDLLAAEELGTLLATSAIRLAILNACRTAEPAYAQPVWGVGPRLARAGIPAVVGMRDAIRDDAAIVFAREFYETIASGHPLEVVLTAARQALMLERGRHQPDWSQPTLFVRTSQTLLFEPQSIVGDRRYVQVSIAARVNREQRERDRHAPRLRTLLSRILALLSPIQFNVDIKVEARLGPALSLIAPVSLALIEPPTFMWKIGDEIARSCQDAVNELGISPLLQAKVRILEGAEAIWESPVTHAELPIPFDPGTESEREHSLICPQAVFGRLKPGRKYYWQLVLTFPALDWDKRLEEHTVTGQAAFRVLSAQEQADLSLLLTSLPSERDEDAESALVRGAIYEAFGLYAKATEAYQRALAEEKLQSQVYRRLADLNRKRAYELLGLPDEIPTPVPLAFARAAN